MAHCPDCSAEVQAGSRFCGQCGRALPLACLHCGFACPPGAKFCGDCGQALGAAAPPKPAPPESAPERRQLTVMFCDLVGSTTLSTRLDPEDHHALLRAYQATCAEAVRRYDGYIAQFLGDGVMVYFGYPVAHEDGPERAVLAGLAIAEAVEKLTVQGQPIRTRVGIATGLVVVGDKIAKGHEWEIGVVGETPNLAARIQGLAQPGEVLIGPATRQLLGTQFEYEERGPQTLKGFADPVPVWRVIAAVAVGSRFMAGQAYHAKLVDRRVEQALLKDLGTKAARRACQTVLIQGEAGIGKSRLARALADWMAESSGARLVEMQCSAHHTQSALFPAVNALWQIVFGGDHRQQPAQAWGGLARFLGDALPGGPPEALPLLARLMAVPAPDGFPGLDLPPERQRAITLQSLLELFAGCGRGGPVLLLVEDLHWADPSTLELAVHIVEHGGERPLLALFTSRPEFDPPWAAHPQVTVIPLGRLQEHDAAELVRDTLAGQGLADDLIESVVAKTDGIPLYLLEYTKAVAEAGGGRGGAAIPATLRDLLLARLDRMGEAKAVAQTAALLGREFDAELLAAVWDGGAAALEAGLEALAREEVVYPQLGPGRRYLFRHALIQDAAYESLLKRRRVALHQRVGEAVEAGFAEIAAAQPEWLAQHFASAGLAERALPYWERAALRANQLAAFAEACRHFRAALGQLALLPESAARHARELNLQVQLAMALQAAYGYAVPELAAVYQRARELCGLLGDTAEQYPVLRGLVSFYIVRCDLVAALELSEQCARLGQETGRPEYQIEAYNCLGYTFAYNGDPRRGAEAAAEGVRLYREHGGERLAYPSPHDPLMGCLALAAKLAWLFGEARLSLRHEQALKETLARLNSPFNDVYGYIYFAFLAQLRGEFARAADYGADTVEVSSRCHLDYMRGVGQALLASSQGRLPGVVDGAPAALKAAIAARQAANGLLFQEYFHAQLAEAYREAGEPWLALTAIEDAFDFAHRHHQHLFLAELHRIRGELLTALGEAGKGEADLREALGIAQRQGAKLFELRAALGLRRLGLGAAGEARALLEAAAGRVDPEDGALVPEWREAAELLAAA